MAFVLIARVTAKEGDQARVAELFGQLAAASREEPGNVFYIPHRDPGNPRAFVVYEQYRDKAAFEAHGASEHFKTIALGELFGLFEDRQRDFYETLD